MSWVDQIRPVLSERYYECHGSTKQKAGLRLDTPADVLRGGDTGPLFVAKKASESLLIKALGYHDKDLQMPPPKDGVNRKLPDAQINDFATWINLGAPLPSQNAVVSDGPHWAFLPLGNPNAKAAALRRILCADNLRQFFYISAPEAEIQ